MSDEMSGLELVKEFARLMDENRYDEAGSMMDPSCRYFFRGDTIEGVQAIVEIYVANYESGSKVLDEICFASEVVAGDAPDLFVIHYTDRIRKKAEWFEHRCQQNVKLTGQKVVEIEHIDLPGEPEKLQAWFESVGVQR